MSSHILRAALQPATAYVDSCGSTEFSGGYPPDKMLFCDKCDECWPASQMVIQRYYDGIYLWCAEGHGCKDHARKEAHAERTRARRSYSARMAWLDRKQAKAQAATQGH